MKVLLILALAALAAADYGKQTEPTNLQLATAIEMAARREAHDSHPKEVEIGDAMDIKWRRNMLSSKPYVSTLHVTAEGEDHPSFSQIYSKILPEQKGYDNHGTFTKNDKSDVLAAFHEGDPIKIHLISESGAYKEVILGNPYFYDTARFAVHIPEHTYVSFESLSEDEATFLSFVSVPAFDPTGHHEFHLAEMKSKFPDHLEHFTEFEKAHHGKDEHWVHQQQKKGDCHLEDLPIFRKRLLKH